jgi:hypothetical protein
MHEISFKTFLAHFIRTFYVSECWLLGELLSEYFCGSGIKTFIFNFENSII